MRAASRSLARPAEQCSALAPLDRELSDIARARAAGLNELALRREQLVVAIEELAHSRQNRSFLDIATRVEEPQQGVQPAMLVD